MRRYITGYLSSVIIIQWLIYQTLPIFLLVWTVKCFLSIITRSLYRRQVIRTPITHSPSKLVPAPSLSPTHWFLTRDSLNFNFVNTTDIHLFLTLVNTSSDRTLYIWLHFNSITTEKNHIYTSYPQDSKCRINVQAWLVWLFIAAWAIFQLSGDCHHYRWKGCKFRPMLSTSGF
jgi:hypothetical protein